MTQSAIRGRLACNSVDMSSVWFQLQLIIWNPGYDRTLRSSGADLAKHKASKSGSSSGYPSAGPDERVIRCPCGSGAETPNMIQVHVYTYLFTVIIC